MHVSIIKHVISNFSDKYKYANLSLINNIRINKSVPKSTIMSQSQPNDTARVTHVIFDLDGLLIDTETQYLRTIKSVLNNKFNCQLPVQLENRIIGQWLKVSIPLIVNELSLPIESEHLIDNVKDEFKRNARNINIMRGGERIVKYFAANHIPMAICSGVTSVTFNTVTKHLNDIFETGKYFHHIVTAGDDREIMRNKPFPDPYLICARRFATIPESMRNVLVFEDTPIGCKSAIAANMSCVFVPDPRLPSPGNRDVEITSNVRMIINSLEEFEPNAFKLPPFE